MHLELRAERDSLVNMQGFFDFVTSPDADHDDLNACGLLEEGVVYSYNIANDPSELLFSAGKQKRFAVGGTSLVRHGSEVTVLLLVGEQGDLRELTEELRRNEVHEARLKEGIEPDPTLERKAVPLFELDNLWQCIFLARFDLSRRTEVPSYMLRDAGNTFMIETADPAIFFDERGEPLFENAEQYVTDLSTRMQEYDPLQELAKTFLLLPSYFEENADRVTIERHPTLYNDIATRLSARRRYAEVPFSWRMRYRDVSALALSPDAGPDASTYTAPDFHVEVSGYWKRLSPTARGRGRNGESIQGKTWVEKRLTWVQQGSTTKRDPVVAASANDRGEGGKGGYLYILRSAAHPKDVFKVGQTTRDPETRAAELSGTTASPDRFLVAQDWYVSDPEAAEAEVHRRLKAYRINPGREFFQIAYKELIQIVSQVVDAFDGDRGVPRS